MADGLPPPALTPRALAGRNPPPLRDAPPPPRRVGFWPRRKSGPMKVRSSLKSLKSRHKDCKLVRRKGRIYVINKTDPRFKAKQG